MLDALYIHIPFCIKKCDYCNFTSFKQEKGDIDNYINAVIEEFKLYPKFEYDTIYFGGGTPSILNAKQIEKILNSLNIKENAEITVEVNPKTATLEKFLEYKKIGINRLSIGIQTFNDNFLKILGRVHNSKDATKTYLDARKAGFENISLDLMFSLPNQTTEDLLFDLKQLFSLKPEHFSIYSLIWEEETPFYEKLQKGFLKETDNELEADMYELIIEQAEKNGYIHYEISNFSLGEKESRHNTKYWNNTKYLGIGVGASGYFDNIRYKNIISLPKYLNMVNSKEFPIIEKEIIDEDTKEVYRYILEMRLLKKGFLAKGKYIKTCEELKEKEFLYNKNNRYFLTRKGLLLFNNVLENFI